MSLKLDWNDISSEYICMMHDCNNENNNKNASAGLTTTYELYKQKIHKTVLFYKRSLKNQFYFVLFS